MSAAFYDQPVLNSPYEYPARHWKLQDGVPTGDTVETRRVAEYVTAVVPKPRRRRGKPAPVTPVAMELGVGVRPDGEHQRDTPPGGRLA